MKLKLAISIFSALLLLVACDRTRQTQETDMKITASQISYDTVEMPYTINANEIQGGVELLSTKEGISISPPNDGVITTFKPKPSNKPIRVVLLDTNDEIIAIDYAVPEVKETLLFNYRNTAQGQLMFNPVFWSWPAEHQIPVYSLLDDHPRFPELVQMVADAGRLPDPHENEEFVQLVTDIAIETAKQYLQDNDLHDFEGGLGTQGVIEDVNDNNGFFSTGSANIVQKDPNDHKSYTVKTGDLLSKRLFVYRKGEVPSDPLQLSNELTQGSNSFIPSKGGFWGWLPYSWNYESQDFTLNVPDDDCQVYEVVIASLAPGPSNDPYALLQSPLLDNLLGVASEVLSLAEIVDANVSLEDFTPDSEASIQSLQILIQSYATAQSAQDFRNAIAEDDLEGAAENFIDWLWENKAEILTIFKVDLEEVAIKSVRKVAPQAVPYIKAAQVAGVVTNVGLFAVEAKLELSGNFPTALISTGDPEFDMELPGNLQGVVGEVLTENFTIKNTGCRALNYEVRDSLAASTFPTKLGAPGSGTLGANEEAEQTLQVTCDHVGSGVVKFVVEAFDPVVGAKIAAVNPVVGVECVNPAPGISEPTPNPLELEADYKGSDTGSFSFSNDGTADLTYILSKNGSYYAQYHQYLNITSPNSGTLPPGGTATITVDTYCRGAVETLRFSVSITSNNPDTPRQDVKIELDCIGKKVVRIAGTSNSSFGPYRDYDAGGVYYSTASVHYTLNGEGFRDNSPRLYGTRDPRSFTPLIVDWHMEQSDKLLPLFLEEFKKERVATNPRYGEVLRSWHDYETRVKGMTSGGVRFYAEVEYFPPQ